MPSAPSKTALLDDLRRRIAHLEHPCLGRDAPPPSLAFGIPEIDGHLPWGGLAPAALHEVVPAAPGNVTPALGFAAALLGRAARIAPVLWCRSRRDLYAPGLKSLGLDAGNLVVVEADKDRELLWAMEEGLRSGALAAVLGEVRDLAVTAARRLQLAAEEGGTLALLTHGGAAPVALTRWRVTAAASRHPLGAWPGAACWQVDLLRCRGGGTGQWFVEWLDERDDAWRSGRAIGGRDDASARGFRLAAPLRDGPLRAAVESPAGALPLRAANAN
jgi:protein ImuA